jgi:hypothetical protein
MLDLQAVQKSNSLCVHTKLPSIFHLAPFGNRAQIVTAKMTFSNNFTPALCEINATANCNFSVPFFKPLRHSVSIV